GGDTHPPTGGVTVIRTHVSERPFIVATVREYLHARDLAVERFLHPVLRVVRDAVGNVTDIGPAADGAPLESLIYAEVRRIGSRVAVDEVRAGIQCSLDDAVAVTDDFAGMVAALDEAVASLDGVARRLPDRIAEVAEVGAFLRWLRPNFVFLASDAWGRVDDADGTLTAAPETGRGLARPDVQARWAEPVLPGSSRHERAAAIPTRTAAAATRHDPTPDPQDPQPTRWPPRLLVVTQTAVESTVHRRVRMHCIAIRGIEDDRIVGERRFVGLFRSRAYAEQAEHIPILRHKLRMLIEQEGWLPGSHDQREAVKVFNSMPKEEL